MLDVLHVPFVLGSIKLLAIYTFPFAEIGNSSSSGSLKVNTCYISN